MSKAAKLNIIIILLLTIGLAVGVFLFKHHRQQATAATSPILVKLGHPEEILLPNTITSTGNLEAVQQTQLSAKVSGYVTKINYQEGSQVKSGDLLIQLDNRKELADVDAAKAKKDIAQLKYQQETKMYHKRLSAYDDFYTAKVNNEQALAAYQSAITALSDKQVRAPFHGVTGAKQISIGDFIQPGTSLVTLTNLNKLRVSYSVPASYLATLKRHQTIRLQVSSLNNATFKGYVSYIAPTIDSQTQTIDVHADITNHDNLLKPGLFVTIQQQLGDPAQVTAIPADTLFASLKGYYVFGVKQGKAYKIPVSVGKRLANHVVITRGLTLTDPLIVAGQTKVQAGSAVIVK